jgi:serine/threonine-protein kinase
VTEEPLVGTLIDRTYRVREKIADGGMGTVYLAVDEKLERRVALKVIKPELGRSAEFVTRFVREAKALASVSHPSLAIVYSFGEDQGLLYMALELVEGAPLHRIIHEQGMLPQARAVEIAAQVLDGLAVIHERGIIHRDLKPPNVVVATRNARDIAKLIDFGLAKLKSASGLTDPNILLGTPTYMSPEQARGDAIAARADLYALAIVLYEMLCGAPPFEAVKVHALLEMQALLPPPPLSSRRPTVAADLEAVVMKGLAKKPAARFQTASEFAIALRMLALPSDVALRGSHRTHGPEGTPVSGLATPALPFVEPG